MLDSDLDRRYREADDLLAELIALAGEASGAVRTCPHCKEKISRLRQFCPNCRQYIAAHHTSTHDRIHKAATQRNLSLPSPQTTEFTLVQRPWFLIVAAVLLVVAGIAMSYFLLPRPQ
ncbi:MAG: hypothetical protein KGR26_09400, partial [Cyanobacteria bacterium REEB65]|nr:hypothetical protein [Cyanobacteria bacterium REEB65]